MARAIFTVDNQLLARFKRVGKANKIRLSSLLRDLLEAWVSEAEKRNLHVINQECVDGAVVRATLRHR